MSPQARREVLKAVPSRYRKAKRQEKQRILDEFVAITGYHRKYSIRILNHGAPKTKGEDSTLSHPYPLAKILK